MNWKPNVVILRHARELQLSVAAAIRSAAPRVKVRGKRGRARAPLGGSMPGKIESPSFLIRKKWGVVLPWNKLGPFLRWFHTGTKKQVTRPLGTFLPDEEVLRSDLEADAARHFAAQDKRQASRRGRRVG